MRSKNTSLYEIIDEFIEYCEIERSLSPATARKYHYRLRRFLDWLRIQKKRDELTLGDLNLDTLRKFRVFLSRQELQESTQYNYLVTIRSFLKFLVKHDYPSVEPEKVELGRHRPARSLKFLKSEELESLLKQPDVKSISGIRDRAILEILFSTGLRVSELASLDKDMIDFKRNEFTVIGKGQRRRVVFLSDTASEWLQKYVERRNDDFVPLFIKYSGPTKDILADSDLADAEKSSEGSRSDEDSADDTQQSSPKKKSKLQMELEDPEGERFRLSVRSIQRLVKKYAKQAGLAVEVTPHVLRHSFATDLLTAGADLRTVQESLGHKNVSTTQIYTHVTNLQLKKAHQKYHGQWRNQDGE